MSELIFIHEFHMKTLVSIFRSQEEDEKDQKDDDSWDKK